ncbi:2588_t:CDS:1 [Scutellospora calospora]|uniref:2588_t:CDS:1 n=1 Tax=Scutellospora calospora TaxID=85575 RepID=A0ACA9JXW1_9GLOM|nr:2588_t:CDS:1 [Scutellospora calospora]
MQIFSEPAETSSTKIVKTSSQNTSSSNKDNSTKTAIEATTETKTKEADESYLTKMVENSDSEKDNNMEEVTFNIVTSKKRKKKNSPKTCSFSSEQPGKGSTQSFP